jgi:hypothetical protein
MKFKVNPSLLLACLLILSCKKETAPGILPTVETSDVSNIGTRSALSGGMIISEGSGKVFARGMEQGALIFNPQSAIRNPKKSPINEKYIPENSG